MDPPKKRKLKSTPITAFFDRRSEKTQRVSSENPDNPSADSSQEHATTEIEETLPHEKNIDKDKDKGDQKHKVTMHFQPKWVEQYGSWLKYDAEKKHMYCQICRELDFYNTMAIGTNNFKTTTITRHATSAQHRQALHVPLGKVNLQESITNVVAKEETGIIIRMKIAYWMAKEAVPLSKFSSLPAFAYLECGLSNSCQMKKLQHGETNR